MRAQSKQAMAVRALNRNEVLVRQREEAMRERRRQQQQEEEEEMMMVGMGSASEGGGHSMRRSIGQNAAAEFASRALRSEITRWVVVVGTCSEYS